MKDEGMGLRFMSVIWYKNCRSSCCMKVSSHFEIQVTFKPEFVYMNLIVWWLYRAELNTADLLQC